MADSAEAAAILRTLPELDQPAILDRVRAHLDPGLSLEEFIHTRVAGGGGRFHL